MPTPPSTSIGAKLLILLSSILLAHSVYSAHEHTHLYSTRPPTLASTSSPTHSPNPPHKLPLDIILETIISVSLLSIGIVLSGWDFRPIQWRKWAGQLEREKGQGPYEFLESRLGFIDIRAKRSEFASWVKEHEATKAT
ncbi:magnesium transporter [Tirmania nivea]|nr:magnesium transporter [Tirmania nivea]